MVCYFIISAINVLQCDYNVMCTHHPTQFFAKWQLNLGMLMPDLWLIVLYNQAAHYRRNILFYKHSHCIATQMSSANRVGNMFSLFVGTFICLTE